MYSKRVAGRRVEKMIAKKDRQLCGLPEWLELLGPYMAPLPFSAQMKDELNHQNPALCKETV